MPKMIHSMIRVRDEARSLAFYELFGLEIAERLDFESFSLIYLSNAESGFELELTVNKDDKTYELGNGYGHLAFLEDDLEALHQRLAEKGLTIQRGSRGTGGKITDGYEYVNLSKVHRDFSMGRLEQRLGPFESLKELQQGKQLTDIQHAFACFERAHRLGRPGKARSFKKGLRKTLKALGSARKVQKTLSSLLAVSSAGNPAFKALSMIGKTMINQLKQQQQTRGRGY